MENKNQPLDLTEYNVVTAKVYNTQTGKMHQEIYILVKKNLFIKKVKHSSIR
jgi:hypothetical protein